LSQKYSSMIPHQTDTLALFGTDFTPEKRQHHTPQYTKDPQVQ